MSRRSGNARNEYRIFVESAIGSDLDNPMENVYGGMVLGGMGSSAVRKVYQRFKLEMKGSRKLRRQISKIENKMSFKWVTPFRPTKKLGSGYAGLGF